MKKIKITRFSPLDYAGTEAFNTLATNLTFLGSDMRRIMVTSCRISEGKSYVALNIMRTLSELGKTVCFVDADLRRSAIRLTYETGRAAKERLGLSHYLAGLCSVEEIVYEVSGLGTLFVPAGRLVLNSLPLLTTKRLPNLLDKLVDDVDYLIVDAPPVGVIVDAAEIAKSCDGTLLVVQHNEIHRKELLEAKLQLEQTGRPILGAVLNGVDVDKLSNRKYYYKSQYYRYGEEYGGKEQRQTPAKLKKKGLK